MNTPDNWKTVAIAHDPDRIVLWQQVFGTDRCPIISMIPKMASVPGKSDVLIYEMDLKAISDEQRRRLIESIATRFDLPPDEVAKNTDEEGVPILAEGVSVASSDSRTLAQFL